MADGRTVVRVFIENSGKVTAQWRLGGLTMKDAAFINLRLDQVKAAILAACADGQPLTEEDNKDIDNLLDGGKK
jgi:activator of HSP90 ATPase